MRSVFSDFGLGVKTQILIKEISQKTITLWKIHYQINYFEEFQDPKVAYYYVLPFGQAGFPKTQLKNYVYLDFTENRRSNIFLYFPIYIYMWMGV